MKLSSQISAFLLAVMVFPAGRALAGDRVCMEAESASEVEAPMALIDVSVSVKLRGDTPLKPQGDGAKPVEGASGRKYLEVAQGKGNPPKVVSGEALYVFSVDSKGQYYLWCRVWWPDECGNSFNISVDDSKSFTFGQDGTFKRWHWVKAPLRLKQLKLTKGKHSLRVKNREDGAKIDQVLLTSDRKYVPVGIEDVTSLKK